MAKIAFILLCHKDPEAIIATGAAADGGGRLHGDPFRCAAPAEHITRMIREALGDNPNVTFAKRRIKCGWGEWSLVQATLNAVRAAVDAFPRATHFYMLSGDCMAIKSAEYAHDFLDAARCGLHRELRFLRKRLDQDRHERGPFDLSALFQRT